MYRLGYYEECYKKEDINAEIRAFFARVNILKETLESHPRLNRLQRARCLNNILYLKEIEREFRAIEYQDDFLHLHKKLRRYLYLDSNHLGDVLANEELKAISLFLI